MNTIAGELAKLPRDVLLLLNYPKTNMERTAQESLSTSGPNSNNEAMKSAQHAAISANEKVFPVFAKKLASKDPADFSATVRKLVTWLKSEKAYYPAARPKIVELLEIALSAFTDTFVHHEAFSEFAELLQQLVQAAMPFSGLFLEPELQSRLQRVIDDTRRSLSTVAKRTTHGNSAHQGVVTANTSPILTPPVDAKSQPIIPPIISSQKPISQLQSLSVPTSVEAVPDDPIVSPLTRNSIEVVPGQSDVNPSLASPVTITLGEPGGNISPSIPSKPLPKRARKAELSEELIARDLDWFRTNQAPPIKIEPLSKADGSSPALVSDTAHIPGRSPSPKKKTTRMVPSRRLPRRIPPSGQTTESDGFSFPSEPLTERTSNLESAEDVAVRNANERQPALERTQSDARPAEIPDTHDVGEVLLHEEPPRSHRVATSNGPPVTPAVLQASHPFALAQARSPRNEFTSLPCPSTPPLESSRKAEFTPTPPRSPQVLQLQSPILPPLVGAWEPPLNLNFDVSRISTVQPQRSIIDPNQPRFDGEMTVIVSTRGKPFSHNHKIDFNLEESVFTRVLKWVNRRFEPSEALRGVCISLACYNLPELFDRIKSENGTLGMEALTSRSPCSWPHSNRLSLHVGSESKHTIVTLAPPLFVTPDQCVDISSLIKAGGNTLEIRQQGDLSAYLVVLHAHHPTRAQLSELDVVKVADERWKQFLGALSAQVAAPGKVSGTISAGVVGVF